MSPTPLIGVSPRALGMYDAADANGAPVSVGVILTGQGDIAVQRNGVTDFHRVDPERALDLARGVVAGNTQFQSLEALRQIATSLVAVSLAQGAR